MSGDAMVQEDRGLEEDTLFEASNRAGIEELRAQLEQERALRAQVEQERDDWRDKALIDAMTGLPNRRAFDMQLERRIEDARREEHALAVLVVDLRNLKAINHEFGMPFADDVLRYVASRMLRVTRNDDAVFLCRIGGDENALIITLEAPDIRTVQVIALRIFESIGQLYKGRGDADVVICISICIGGHVMGHETVNAEELYDRAAENLEEAKKIAYNPKSVVPPIVLTV